MNRDIVIIVLLEIECFLAGILFGASIGLQLGGN